MLNVLTLLRRQRAGECAVSADDRSVFWLLSSVGMALMVAAWLLPWFIEQTIIGVTKKSGYGYSAQDALTQLVTGSPTGIGSVLVLILFVCMLALIAGFVWDALTSYAKDRKPHDKVRERALGLAGAVAFLIFAAVIGMGLQLPTVAAGAAALALAVTFALDGATLVFGGRQPFQYMTQRGVAALIGVVCTLLIWVLISIEREEDLFGHLSPNAITDNAVWMMLTGMAVCAFAFLGNRRMVLLIGGFAVATVTVVGAVTPWMRTDALRKDRVYGSLLDALQTFDGLSSILLWLTALAVLVVAAGFVADAVVSVRARDVRIVYGMQRGLVALAGAATATLATWIVVRSRNNAFGSKIHVIDDRAGVIIGGLCATALVLLLGERLVANRQVGLGVVAFALAGLFPLIFNQSVGFIFWGASIAAIYTLLALGLNVVVGFAGLLDLGYAAFFAIGAYTAASLTSQKHGIFISFWFAIFAAAAMAALFGVLLGAPTLRLRGDYLAIVTLGFGEIIPDLAKNNLLNETGGPNGITGIASPDIFAYRFGLDSRPFFWALLIVIGLVMVVLRNLERSRLGRAWVAVREDEIAASATGINTVSTKLLAFAIGASVSGLAGAFLGAQLGIVTNEDFAFAVSVTALSTVVLGGIGSNVGAALGGVTISFIIFWVLPHLQEWMGTFGENTGITTLSTIDYSQYKYIVYGAILILVMLLRPGGLLPSRARRIELTAGEESAPLAAVREVA